MEYTPVQVRILNLFADGQPHTSREICDAIDDMCSHKNMRTHLMLLRKKLEKIGENILCTVQGREKHGLGGLKLRYVHVSRLVSTSKE